MRLHYTNFSFFNSFKNGVAFPFLVVLAFPLLVQQQGCDPEYDKPPKCTSLTSPAPGTSDIGETVTLKWAVAPGASAYKLKVTSQLNGELYSGDTGAKTEYTLNNLVKNDRISVVITPHNKHGDASSCSEFSFTTVKEMMSSPPGCAEITSPANGATGVELMPKINWKPASGNPSGYIFKATSPNGALNLNYQLGANVTSYEEIGMLAYEQEVTVSVTPINDAGQATGCQSITFTTKKAPPKPEPPSCVSLLNPANNASDVAVNTSLRWNRSTSGGIQGYIIKVGTAPGEADLVDTSVSGSKTSYKPGKEFPHETKIYVQITPFNNLEAENCIEESFTTEKEPQTPPDDGGGNTVDPEEPRYVRKNIAELNFNDPVLVTYRRAVELMKALPADHPHNWDQQAKIHHDHCPHGAWFFLPWHRAYLYYFEETIRQVTGDDDFALPYWDWTKNPQIPAAFWGDNNPMFNPTRTKTATDTPGDSYVGEEEIDDILTIEDFGLFASSESRSGALERTPHNYIHGWVGGNMGYVNSAAKDALFWCHHANVDRLWAMWNEYGNANTDDNKWTDHIFDDNFYDRSGNHIDISVADVASTYSLDYRYDTQSATEPQTAWQSLPVSYEAIEGLTFVKGLFGKTKISEPFTVNMEPSADFLNRLNDLLDAPPGDVPEAAFLFIDSIAPPMKEDVFINVFVNHPDIKVSTPVRDRNHVESFGFFRMGAMPSQGGGHEGGHDHGDMGSFIFDMTPTLRAIREATNAPIDKIQIQLIAVPFSGNAAEAMFSPGKFMIQLAKKS